MDSMRTTERLDSDMSSGDLTVRIEEDSPDRLRAVALAATTAGRELKHIRACAREREIGVPYATKDYCPAIRALELVLLEGRDSHWVEEISSVDRFFLLYIAVHEWETAKCWTCHGVKFLQPIGEARINCPDCSASGVHRFSNAKRERYFGRPLDKIHSRFLEAVCREIANQDMLSNDAIKRKLK